MYCVDVTSIVNAVFEEAEWVAEKDRSNAIKREPAAISKAPPVGNTNRMTRLTGSIFYDAIKLRA